MAKTLGQVLADARNKKGLSLRDVEKATEINNGHLSQIEKGDITKPAAGILWQLANVYELDFSHLMQLGEKAGRGEKDRRSLACRDGASYCRGPDAGRRDRAPPVHGAAAAAQNATPGVVVAVDPLLRRQIIAASEKALRAASAVDVLPTPLESVVEAIGVREVIPTADLPQDLVVARPGSWRRILGASSTKPDRVRQPISASRTSAVHPRP